VEKPTRNAVGLVLTNREGKILLVKRLPDDKDLPNMWGLPAGSGGATSESVASRKLGLDVSPGSVIAEGTLDRASYLLRMQLVSASADTEAVRMGSCPDGRDTYYIDYRWVPLEGAIGFLRFSAFEGSLCSALYMRCRGIFHEAHMKQLGIQVISFTQIQEN